MSGNDGKKNSKYKPPAIDELMKALAAKNDKKAVTVFSRALFLVDVPDFKVTYEGSKAEGMPIRFGMAGAMAGYCYVHMDKRRIEWKVYANVSDKASEPREDFIGYLADALKLPTFKKYYSDFLSSIEVSEGNEYYEAMEAEKTKYPQDPAVKEAEAQEVAKQLREFYRFSNFIDATAKKPVGGAGSKRTRRSRSRNSSSSSSRSRRSRR